MLIDTQEPDMLDLSEVAQVELLTDTESGAVPDGPEEDPPQVPEWTPEGGFVA